MKAVIQKVSEASVKVDDRIVGKIGTGIVVLIGINTSDTEENVKKMAKKISELRIFQNEDKYFDKSVLEINGEILVISQFTLYGNCDNGRRPDFVEAQKSELAKPLYEKFLDLLKEKNIKLQSGIFGADMKLNLTNDGPVTLIIEN